MVVPHGDPRHGRVQCLQIRVGAVLGVTGAVVVQADDVVGGRCHAPQRDGVLVAKFRWVRAIFVDVVAQVNSVLRARLGRRVVHIEVARGIQSAREHCELHTGDVAGRQRARSAHGGAGAVLVQKAEVVSGACDQACRVHLVGEAGISAGGHVAGGNDAVKRLAGADLPGQCQAVVEAGHLGMRPEHDAVCQRVTAGNTVFEFGGGRVAAAAGNESGTDGADRSNGARRLDQEVAAIGGLL